LKHFRTTLLSANHYFIVVIGRYNSKMEYLTYSIDCLLGIWFHPVRCRLGMSKNPLNSAPSMNGGGEKWNTKWAIF